MARRKEAAWDEEAQNPNNGDTEQNQETRDESGLTASERRKLTPEQKRERFIQIFGYSPEDENPSQRFSRVGAGRVSRIIDGLRTLPALGNKSNYEFRPEHAEQMFDRIEQELHEARKQFTRNSVEGISRSKSFSFT